jgi:hypothetical protein
MIAMPGEKKDEEKEEKKDASLRSVAATGSAIGGIQDIRSPEGVGTAAAVM